MAFRASVSVTPWKFDAADLLILFGALIAEATQLQVMFVVDKVLRTLVGSTCIFPFTAMCKIGVRAVYISTQQTLMIMLQSILVRALKGRAATFMVAASLLVDICTV
jgi:hypothetical protein